MSEKKYQVFISSTYTDLIEERKKILDILLMADCIPAGMEAFTATDLEQFEVIKRVIDLCDYYVLIIGKRYGSINPDTGISYTEMEYNYALEQGVPVLVFALDASVNLPPEKTESEPEKIKKLDEFRTKAMTNRLASVWTNAEDLTGKLAIAIMNAKVQISRPGWQRSQDFDEASLRREIMELQAENAILSNELKTSKEKILLLTEQNDVAFDNCELTIAYHYYYNHQRVDKTKKLQLKDIFIAISIQMLDVIIAESVVEDLIENLVDDSHSVCLDDKQIAKKVLNQLRAAGLLYSKWSDKKGILYWGLTDKGIKVRDDNTIIKTTNSSTLI